MIMTLQSPLRISNLTRKKGKTVSKGSRRKAIRRALNSPPKKALTTSSIAFGRIKTQRIQRKSLITNGNSFGKKSKKYTIDSLSSPSQFTGKNTA